MRFEATPLGGHEYLVAPGTPHVHDAEGWVVYVSPNPLLLVVPEGGSWVAATSYGGAKVDLCRNIAVDVGSVEFVDVELDVMWRWGEPAGIEDVEDFDALGLPDAEASRLFAEADRIRACVDAGATAVVWLDAGGSDVLVATADTTEGRAMGSFLMATAPTLRSYAPPPLPASTEKA